MKRKGFLKDICKIYSFALLLIYVFLGICANHKFYILIVPFNIVSYIEDDDDTDDGRVAADEHCTRSPSPQKDWPSHARRRTGKGKGVYCINNFLQHLPSLI